MDLYVTDKEYKERLDYFLKMMKEINWMSQLVI